MLNSPPTVLAAQRLRTAYWLYRVYVDPNREAHYEVALLPDPLNSNAVRTVTRFDLVEGSGAKWFAMVDTVDDKAAAGDGKSKYAADQVAAESSSDVPVPKQKAMSIYLYTLNIY